MQPRRQHDGLVTELNVLNCRQHIEQQSLEEADEALRGLEPDLARYVRDGIHIIVGRLSLSGAPGNVVEGVHTDVYQLVLVAIESFRSAQREYWDRDFTDDDDSDDDDSDDDDSDDDSAGVENSAA